MTAEKLLGEAAAVVRDRRHTYGQPLDLFERVAARWWCSERKSRQHRSWWA